MRKKITQLLLASLIGLFLFSCNNTTGKFPLSNMDTDFAVAEQLDFELYKPLKVMHDNFIDDDVMTGNINVVDDSVLWYVEPFDREEVVSTCYNLNTGEPLGGDRITR